MELQEYRIAVFDKGFNRYSCLEKWSHSNRYFVTSKKDKAKYEIVMEFDCSHSQELESD
jgi:hypothetical protein